MTEPAGQQGGSIKAMGRYRILSKNRRSSVIMKNVFDMSCNADTYCHVTPPTTENRVGCHSDRKKQS